LNNLVKELQSTSECSQLSSFSVSSADSFGAPKNVFSPSLQLSNVLEGLANDTNNNNCFYSDPSK